MKSKSQKTLNLDLTTRLKELNPWWEDKAMRSLPNTRRHLVSQIKRRIKFNIAPITVVRGARQIGKTTACLQVIADLLGSGVSKKNILRVQFDEIESLGGMNEPILQITDWYQSNVLNNNLNQMARDGQPVFLFFDEVQNLDKWAEQLKFLVDANTVQVIVTGSSALRIEQGRDSLAGRIHTLEVGVLSLTEIGIFRGEPTPEPFLADNGLEKLTKIAFWQDLQAHAKANLAFRNEMFEAFSERGAYPLVHEKKDVPWSLLADQLNETVIRRVIQHDLRIGERGRKRDPDLLEEMFRYCCRYAGQAPSKTAIAREMQASLAANIGPQRVQAYLKFLADTLLIRTIQPLEIRLKKLRSDPKICLVDHGLRASWLQEHIPISPMATDIDQSQATIAGFLAESITGALFSSISGLDIAHQPARGKLPEIDFVLTVGAFRIPIEVKYRNQIEKEHIDGLRWFLDNPANRAPFGLLITKHDHVDVGDDRVVPISLSTAMLLR